MRTARSCAFLGAVALGVAAATACGDSTGPTMAELFVNRATWSARGPPSYTFEYRRSCGECPVGADQPVSITVVDGEVASVVKIPTGEAVPPPAFRLTIDSLFVQIANTLAQRPYRFTARYDPILGYPLSVAVDLDRQMVDDEWGFVVVHLLPR
jgi:hypothetical protein